jgi:hypothetical protein
MRQGPASWSIAAAASLSHRSLLCDSSPFLHGRSAECEAVAHLLVRCACRRGPGAARALMIAMISACRAFRAFRAARAARAFRAARAARAGRVSKGLRDAPAGSRSNSSSSVRPPPRAAASSGSSSDSTHSGDTPRDAGLDAHSGDAHIGSGDHGNGVAIHGY